MVNKFPIWKNIVLLVIALLSLLYAAPNLYGEDPAIQINATNGVTIQPIILDKAKTLLVDAKITYKSAEMLGSQILIRFHDTDQQLKGIDILKTSLGDDYTVAANLAPAMPNWLEKIGAMPAKLGLDLRGGVNFLLDIDINTVINQRLEGEVKNFRNALRDAGLHYDVVDMRKPNKVIIGFADDAIADQAYTLLHRQFPQWVITRLGRQQLLGDMSQDMLNSIKQSAIEQTMTTLRNRINELGIAEAVVQQQGLERVSVELPGVLDTARAKQILGGTATLEFRLVDVSHDARLAAQGNVPLGSVLYSYQGSPMLLQDRIVLTGNSITDATASFGEDGRPIVNISLGGGGESLFHRVTGENIGKPMAIVYVETKLASHLQNGQIVKIPRKVQRIISAPIIQSALGSRFQITGLRSPEEARDLALLLRAGALLAPISIVEERIIGPQLGMENIRMGIVSVVAGLAMVALFMAFYYSLFGLIADLALTLNLVLLVAVLSLLGATLTLPGIAGIVLTVGMAVDANVLIFERIREELRNGASIQASIHAGYERAFATIVDANITTLIVALVLFGLGTGPIKGFAVTLSIGILTSMLTGITFTRAIVNAIYGGRQVSKLRIGI